MNEKDIRRIVYEKFEDWCRAVGGVVEYPKSYIIACRVPLRHDNSYVEIWVRENPPILEVYIDGEDKLYSSEQRILFKPDRAYARFFDNKEEATFIAGYKDDKSISLTYDKKRRLLLVDVFHGESHTRFA